MSVDDRLTEKVIGTVKGTAGTYKLTVKDNVIKVKGDDGKTTLSTT